MRRLALLLVLGTSALACARDFGGANSYLRLRAEKGIVQAVGSAALRNVLSPRVLELQGKVVGTCRTGDTTVLLFQYGENETQEVEAKNLPDWLAITSDPVRLLVKCARSEAGAALKATLLDAAPEVDVLPVEEAYWRKMAAARKASAAASLTTAKAPASAKFAYRSGLYGAIGSRHAATSHREWSLPASSAAPQYAAFILKQNPKLGSNQALKIAQDLIGFSLHYHVDARLVIAMLVVESDFDPNSISRSGAVGLGQLMPSTARWMGVQNSYNTTENLYGTVKLLRTHLDQYNTPQGSDLSLVLAAYNAGAGAVKRHGGVPPYRETQAYVRRVIGIYKHLCGYA